MYASVKGFDYSEGFKANYEAFRLIGPNLDSLIYYKPDNQNCYVGYSEASVAMVEEFKKDIDFI